MGNRRRTWNQPLDGLPLVRPTPDGWAEVALGELDALLEDHAWCEHKAASAALGLIARFPDRTQLVRPLTELAQEEMRHFRDVTDLIAARGRRLGPPRPDRYVHALRERSCSHGDGLGALGDVLLASAFIEARSCERFRLLADALDERPGPLADLGETYARFGEAEARHWTMFRDLAATLVAPARLARRLDEVAQMESDLVATLPTEPRMH